MKESTAIIRMLSAMDPAVLIQVSKNKYFVYCNCGQIEYPQVYLNAYQYKGQIIGAIGKCHKCGRIYYWLQ